MAEVGVEWVASESGIEDFERFLEHAIRESGDMRIPLEDTKDHVQSMIRDEFDSDGERSGGWEPLNHHYDLWKINHSQYQMLVLDVALLHGDPGTPRDERMKDVVLADTAWAVSSTDAIFAPNSERAAWHQVGLPFRRTSHVKEKFKYSPGRLPGFANPLPERPWLVFLETDYEEIEDFFTSWMDMDVLDG